DRLNGSLGLGGIAAAGLGHVGTPAAAAATEHLGAEPHQIDGVEAAGQILGDADDDRRLVAVPADENHNTRSNPRLAVVDEALQVFRIDAVDDARHQLDAGNLAHSVTGLAATAHSELLPGLRQFALKPAALLDQCRHPTRRILRRDLQQRGDLLELFVTLLEIAARRRTRQRLDPAHAGSDRTLGDQSHETNV